MIKVLPVVHYLSDEQAIQQSLLAYSLNADGIFLISHCGSNERLGPLAKTIKSLTKNFKVGINLLGNTIMETAKESEKYELDMICGDSCGVSSKGINAEGEELFRWGQKNSKIEIFASVAFKYQKIETNPPLAASNAKNSGFIPTTSGSGTGSAPELAKIMSMSNKTNGLLAIASGMTCENILDFKSYLSHVLVATGVSQDENHFNLSKLEKFIKIIKA
jgi:predicted TIM-barrel enzyme